ncbi:hypothetical protein [Nitrospira sp. BLG_2]|uniref:hypothetical protein n=1 Tax=Nitrospira sp. BLG_2 TaxID=3397507 RepID=UPI003B9B2021
MDLELYSTDELIDEITKRTSFVGIVIRSTVEPKLEKIVIHQNWDITYSNAFSEKQVAELLEDVVDHFHHLAEGEE